MKDKLIIAGISIGAFLLGTLMPRTPEIQEKVVTEVVRDTIKYTEVVSVPVKTPPEKQTEFVYVSNADTVWVHDTVWVRMPRQYYYAETDDVKIWHSGIDSRIDSLINIRETRKITETYAEPWKRHSLSIAGETGYFGGFRLSAGVMYQYDIFKWLSASANVGYDLYLKQPYAMAGIRINVYSR